MVKAMMLMDPRRFKGLLLQQRPVRLRAASSRPKFKQKLAKYKEMRRNSNRGKLQECGKILNDKCLACSLLGRKKRGKKQKHGFAYFLLDYMRTDQVLIARMPQEQQRILNKVL